MLVPYFCWFLDFFLLYLYIGTVWYYTFGAGDPVLKKNSEKTEQVTVSDTRRLVSKNNNTTSYHRPDPSSGTMLPEVIALLYDGALPWSSIALDHGRGGSTGAVRVR